MTCVVGQVWQWIRHGARLEDNGQLVSRSLVQKLISHFLEEYMSMENQAMESKRDIVTAAIMFEEIVTKRYFPEFITTYLYLDHTFLNAHIVQTSLL